MGTPGACYGEKLFKFRATDMAECLSDAIQPDYTPNTPLSVYSPAFLLIPFPLLPRLNHYFPLIWLMNPDG